MEPVTPFDWQRLWVGVQPPVYLLEIAFRAAFLYLFTLLAFRLIGKRGMGHLSPFETVIVVALGTSLGDPIFMPDVPITYGMVMSVSLLLTVRVMHSLKTRFPVVEAVVESQATLLVQDGEIDEVALRRVRVAQDELFMLLREEGVTDLSHVDYAFLETSGRLSVFTSERVTGRRRQAIVPLPKNPDDPDGD